MQGRALRGHALGMGRQKIQELTPHAWLPEFFQVVGDALDGYTLAGLVPEEVTDAIGHAHQIVDVVCTHPPPPSPGTSMPAA